LRAGIGVRETTIEGRKRDGRQGGLAAYHREAV
jgi:hypothetical protein